MTRTGAWVNGRDDASLGRLMAELDRAQVARGCLVGLAGVVDDEYILAAARDGNSRLVPIAGFDPSAFDAASIRERVFELKRQGFLGLKLHPRLNGYDPLDPRAVGAIGAARDAGLVTFVDTLFRQRGRATSSAADIVDRLAQSCDGAPIVLLHGGGPAIMQVAEVVRLHQALVLDVSYTLLAYAGSSLDQDLRWIFQRLDRRVVVGSDMPEYTPAEAFEQAARLADGLPPEKWANISHANLERLFPEHPCG